MKEICYEFLIKLSERSGKESSIGVQIGFNYTHTICSDEEGLYQFYIPDDLKCLTIMMEHRRENMRQTEKTNLNLQHRKKPVYSTQFNNGNIVMKKLE
jgi:hypothetical protein